MKTYLMRHCEAESGEPLDPTRALTDTGKQQAAEMAAFLVRQIGRVDLVISSPFVRAKQTAEVMAEALGCHRLEFTPHLDPDGRAKPAWEIIDALTKLIVPADDPHVLVVSHHPLINALAEYTCGIHTDDEHWRHGAVMHIHGDAPDGIVEYFVPPKVIERDEALNAVSEVAEAAVLLTTHFSPSNEGEKRAVESLKHPKHAAILEPLRAQVESVARRLFKRQHRLIVKHIGPRLRSIVDARPKLAEADKDTDDAKQVISSALPDGYLIPLVLTKSMTADYEQAIAAAIEAGFDVLAKDNGSTAELSDDVVEEYLRNHSLKKLTGELDGTTVERLRTALADAYDSGEDYDGMVEAIKDEFENMTDPRAKMTAQTELNDAYNHGRRALGDALGFNEKAWSLDGPTPCPECIGNSLDGWIPIEDAFSSGDLMPTAHPGCYCSLDVRSKPATPNQ